MDKATLKAIVMAILSPNGQSMNLNEMNMNYLEKNADEIIKRSGCKEKKTR